MSQTREEILRRTGEIIQQVLNVGQRPLFVKGCDINEFFKYNINEFKGENSILEKERWLQFIWVNYRIKHQYDFMKDGFLFVKYPEA